MPKYENGRIYKLISDKTEDIYIGSTCLPLYKRKSAHKGDYKLWKNNKRRYVTSFEIVKHDHVDIILIEMYSCNSKEKLHARERYWIEKLNSVNKIIPGRTITEYRVDNKDKLREYQKKYDKKWYEANNEKIQCGCGSNIRKSGIAKHYKTKKHLAYIPQT